MAHTKRFWLKCSAGLPLLAPYLFFLRFQHIHPSASWAHIGWQLTAALIYISATAVPLWVWRTEQGGIQND